jgi:imidazolonepropionase-like amidohydrolase
MWWPGSCCLTVPWSSTITASPVLSRLATRRLKVLRSWTCPLAAIQSATIHAAELMRLDDRVGRIAPGYLADVIAVDGNPLQDIRLLENTVFVMKDGAIRHRGPDTQAAQA